ncbi:MAG: type II secretion system protein [Terracidiphilus sp.]
MRERFPNPRRTPTAAARDGEDGYALLAVIFLMALMVLWLSVAVPKMARQIQRDREVETMHRGKQYIRAIRLYYRKFHAYPPSIDALVKTNDIRFLRKKYIDPMTGKDDWKPIMFGQNKVPTAMGFFGQPLSTGSAIAGIGPSGGNGINGMNGQAPGGSIFDTNGAGSTTQPTTGSTDSSGNPSGSATGGTTTATGGSGGTDANGNPISGTGGIGSGPSGQTFGGAGIIGFSPGDSKQSILVYKKKDHYNEWEFTYDPIMEMMMQGGGNAGMMGQPNGGASGVPGFGSSNPNSPGSGIQNGPGFGAGGGIGSSPITPPETPAPQQ